MVEYADRECESCHGLFPGNLMRTRDKSVEIGSSTKPWNPSADFAHNMHRTTTHHRTISLLLCPACYKKAGGSLSWLWLLAAACIPLFMAANGSKPETQSSNAVGGAVPNQSLSAKVQSAQDTEQTDTEQNLDDFSGSDITQLAPDVVGLSASNEPLPLPSRSYEPFSPVPKELAAKMQEAAGSGKAVRWRSHRDAGYAVPSESASATGCRNVFYTVDDRKGDWKSPVEQICSSK